MSGSPAVQHPPAPRTAAIHTSLLVLMRLLWVGIVLLYLAAFIMLLPVVLRQFQTICSGANCIAGQLNTTAVHQLHAIHITLASYAVSRVVMACIGVALYDAMAVLLFVRRGSDRLALLVSLMLVLTAATDFMAQAPRYQVANLLNEAGVLCVFLVLALFPSGRFLPRWSPWMILGMGILALLPVQMTPWRDVLATTQGLAFLGVLLFLLGCQIYRYRSLSTFGQRQQTKWVLFGLLLVGGAEIVLFAAFIVPAPAQSTSLVAALTQVLFDLSLFSIPITVGIAILKYRLFAIDLILNRTLVYGALTVSIAGLYILVVGYLGAVFRVGSNLLISLLAAGLVAVLFQPLREWFQRGVNRLIFGQRDEPYTIVAQLGRRLESTLASDAILPTVAATVAEALKLPYAAISLKQDETFITVATYGIPVAGILTLPLIYQAEIIGQMELGPRQPGETFTSADRRLLADLVRQVGLAAHAVRLTADVQRSRERLVMAREEERRRLRRDLHDGLGATLAALHLQAGAIRTLMRQDLAEADAALIEFQGEIRSAVGDIRRLVYALRPPALDEFGLVGAIQQYALQYDTPDSTMGVSGGRVRVLIEAPESAPALPAAVEVAAYRIVQEALTNVVQHAQAQTCSIRLSLPDDHKRWLQVEINDDGIGLPDEPHAGVGLHSMRERAEEVGGTCLITAKAAHGTQVVVCLPLPQEETHGHAPRVVR